MANSDAESKIETLERCIEGLETTIGELRGLVAQYHQSVCKLILDLRHYDRALHAVDTKLHFGYRPLSEGLTPVE